MTFEFVGLFSTVAGALWLWFRLMRWLFPRGIAAAGTKRVYVSRRLTLMDEMRARELDRICRWGKR